MLTIIFLHNILCLHCCQCGHLGHSFFYYLVFGSADTTLPEMETIILFMNTPLTNELSLDIKKHFLHFLNEGSHDDEFQ